MYNSSIYTATVLAEGWKNVICSCAFRRVVEFPFGCKIIIIIKKLFFFLFFPFFFDPWVTTIGGGRGLKLGPAVLTRVIMLYIGFLLLYEHIVYLDLRNLKKYLQFCQPNKMFFIIFYNNIEPFEILKMLLMLRIIRMKIMYVLLCRYCYCMSYSIDYYYYNNIATFY